MRWYSEIDYHGSRSYGAEPLPESGFGRHIARLVDVAKRAWRKAAPKTTTATMLLRDGQHRFSLLGVDSGAVPASKAAECPFPTKGDPVDNHDCRVFP